jgi:hypothetical protein
MKSYSTHAEKLKGPIQINRVIVKASPQVITNLWGKSAVEPLIQIQGSGSWQPDWKTPPIVIAEREYVGFQIEPPTATVSIQTLYSPLSE